MSDKKRSLPSPTVSMAKREQEFLSYTCDLPTTASNPVQKLIAAI